MIAPIVVVPIVEMALVYSGSVQMHTEGVRLGAIEHVGGYVGLVQGGGY